MALLGKGRNHRFDFLAKNQYMNNSLIFLVYHTTIFAVIFAGVMSIAFSRTWALNVIHAHEAYMLRGGVVLTVPVS